MFTKRIKGKCRVGGEEDKWLDGRGMCSVCAFKLDSADRRAEDVRGIRRDMERMGIPVNVKYKKGDLDYEAVD